MKPDVGRLREGPTIRVAYRESPTPWVECHVINDDNDMGCEVEDQVTARARGSAPVDPARATAERFLALVGHVPTRLHFGEVRPEGDHELRATTGPGAFAPVLLFEATRSSLVGSRWAYRPWISVRATLLDRDGSKVLWRDSCASLSPADGPGASPDELAADHGALYARMLDDEAQRCANDLVFKFRPTSAPPGMTSGGATPK